MDNLQNYSLQELLNKNTLLQIEFEKNPSKREQIVVSTRKVCAEIKRRRGLQNYQQLAS